MNTYRKVRFTCGNDGWPVATGRRCGAQEWHSRPETDGGHAVLVGMPPSGQMVGPTGMSDGTCDPLYSALRRAPLDSSVDGHETLPFIVDDSLIMLGDDRAAAALKVLSHLSEKTQVVFFTRHEHLVQIACNALDSASLHPHRL